MSMNTKTIPLKQYIAVYNAKNVNKFLNASRNTAGQIARGARDVFITYDETNGRIKRVFEVRVIKELKSFKQLGLLKDLYAKSDRGARL